MEHKGSRGLKGRKNRLSDESSQSTRQLPLVQVKFQNLNYVGLKAVSKVTVLGYTSNKRKK